MRMALLPVDCSWNGHKKHKKSRTGSRQDAGCFLSRPDLHFVRGGDCFGVGLPFQRWLKTAILTEAPGCQQGLLLINDEPGGERGLATSDNDHFLVGASGR